jgi:hypothetical protein
MGGYLAVIMALIVAAGGITIGVMGKRIEKLNRNLGVAETAIAAAIEANADNQETIDKLEVLLDECVKLRAEAEVNVDIIMRELIERALITKQEADERSEQIEQIVQSDPNADDCIAVAVVPSRATELLITAATSANRGEDGH